MIAFTTPFIWIVALATATTVALTVWVSRRTRVAYVELGAMSEQWLAEQRVNDRPY